MWHFRGGGGVSKNVRKKCHVLIEWSLRKKTESFSGQFLRPPLQRLARLSPTCRVTWSSGSAGPSPSACRCSSSSPPSSGTGTCSSTTHCSKFLTWLLLRWQSILNRVLLLYLSLSKLNNFVWYATSIVDQHFRLTLSNVCCFIFFFWHT